MGNFLKALGIATAIVSSISLLIAILVVLLMAYGGAVFLAVGALILIVAITASFYQDFEKDG